MKEALIIFQKNRIPGQVKTRLAKTLGDEKALEIYDFMVANTHTCAKQADVSTFVYFSHQAEEQELWNYAQVTVQTQDPDLGIRMFDAISEKLQEGFEKVVLIGTDFLDFKAEFITDAFSKLITRDYVFGPSEDGGYYLVGCKKIHTEVFYDKVWSTETVLKEALAEINTLGLSVDFTEIINDIDTEEDLGNWRSFFQLT
jgi:uncharacterized protein